VSRRLRVLDPAAGNFFLPHECKVAFYIRAPEKKSASSARMAPAARRVSSLAQSTKRLRRPALATLTGGSISVCSNGCFDDCFWPPAPMPC